MSYDMSLEYEIYKTKLQVEEWYVWLVLIGH